MPERGFDTDFWSDPFVQHLPQEAKTLFAYLFTNNHCNPAGLYEITLETISFETKLPLETIPELLRSLEKKVVWFPDDNLIWVKNFIKRQSKSSKFLQAAAKSLVHIHVNGPIQQILQYNQDKYGISIPYQYYMDRVPIPSSASASASANANKEGGTGGENDSALAAIVTIYEQNIGIVTPMVAERLKIIADTYPVDWFEAAVREALASNARSLKYIEAVLQRWSVEGFKSAKKRSPPPPGKVPTKDQLDEQERKRGLR